MSDSATYVCYPSDTDASWVTQNIESYLVEPFEALNVKLLFEMSPWSLIVKGKKETEAYAAFVDYPYQDHWSNEWYDSVKKDWEHSEYFGPRALFLHNLVCKADAMKILEDLLRLTFLSIHSLKSCCILVRKPRQMNKSFESFFARDESLETDGFEFWMTRRDSFTSKVGIRNKRCEDYLELKKLFSQTYGPVKEDDLRKFTLDFLDYGEDRMATYKYFTFDDDNTFVGIAENEQERAVALMYATIQRVDLDSMNRLFQLESVYGLRKRHPEDSPGIDFANDSASGSEDSDEEGEVREMIASLVDEVVSDVEVFNCMRDLVDEVCTSKRHSKKLDSGIDGVHYPTFLNSREFDLKNPSHLQLVNKRNMRYFTTATLLRLVNSGMFDPSYRIHMRLLPPLGSSIKEIEKGRLEEILDSDLFDPAAEDFALLAVHIISYMPEKKLHRFQKSVIGNKIYERLMYRMAEEKQAAVSKAKKNKPAPKLSFKDTQIMLHHAKSLKRIERAKTNASKTEKTAKNNTLACVSYRNMGFISGLTNRNQFAVQDSSSFSKATAPTIDENKDETSAQAASASTTGLGLLRDIPVYFGGTNCLHIEQFAIEKKYEHQSLLLIAAAFLYFPRVDYCMTLLPYGTKQVSFLRQYFFSIPARPFSPCEKELFVLHKASLSASYEIRLYEDDFKEVQKLVSSSCLKDFLLGDLKNSPRDKTVKTVVLISEGKVCGIAMIKDMKEVETIRRKYDVTERINMKYHKYTSQGLLLHCVLHPIFKFLASAFIKEAMRLSGKSILYYKIYPTYLVPSDPSAWKSLCNILEQLITLKPTEKPSKSYIVLKAKGGDAKQTKKETESRANKTDDESKYYCLAYTCTNTVLKYKNIKSSRIVVIGDSDTALGVLESLVYSKKFKYTNLTIVTKNGMKGECHLDSKCYSFLPDGMDYPKLVLVGMCLPVWVTVVRGEVVSIKTDKLVLQETVEEKLKRFVCYYDYLVVCCDLEFPTSCLRKSAPEDAIRGSAMLQYPLLKKLVKWDITVERNPANVFAVNSAQEAAEVLNWLWKFYSNKVESRKQPKKNIKYKNLTDIERGKKEGRIVLYGNFLAAYSALAVLVAEDFPMSKITFIKPKKNTSPFQTDILEDVAEFIIGKTSVEMISDAYIEYDNTLKEVLTLEVTADRGTSRLDCCALLLFNEKKINYNSLAALHKSCLSFTLPKTESRGHPYLLINQNFRTNAKNVFAAGTATAMHAGDAEMTRFEDCVYNEREIGAIVGRNLDDLIANAPPSNEQPILSRPRVTYAEMPGGYFYALISSPSPVFKAKNNKTVENGVARLVLGNLNTGANFIPAFEAKSAKAPALKENQDSIALESADETNATQKEPKNSLKEAGNALQKAKNSSSGKDESTRQEDTINVEQHVEDTNQEVVIGKEDAITSKISVPSKPEDGLVEQPALNENQDSIALESADGTNATQKKENNNLIENDNELVQNAKNSASGKDESARQEEIINVEQHEEKTNPEAAVEKDETITSKTIIPEEPDYFALSFDRNESITTIECFTKKNLDVVVLKRLCEINVSQLFKILSKVVDKDTKKISFRLTEDWTLPLDYVMFEEGGQDEKKVGYGGYWKQGYPQHIQTKLNSFLDSFTDRKKK